MKGVQSLQDIHMNDSGERGKEATGRKTQVLRTKANTIIIFRNVRTMYKTKKLAQVTAEMRRYTISYLAREDGKGLVGTELLQVRHTPQW